MAKKYPIIGRTENRERNTQAKCVACGDIGKYRVHIEISWFRGEDEVLWACKDHKNDADLLLRSTQ